MAQEAEAHDAAPQRQEQARRHIQVVTETQMRLRQLEAGRRAARAAPLPPKPARAQYYYAELQSPTMAARPR
ncbi:hypothetical protein [Streptomyces sp. NPDC001165]|uniref:hypothetical protein n=1 Tax=Streptomyces sp. NPDC001165 TaxID=3364546 RepID=UPI0036828759